MRHYAARSAAVEASCCRLLRSLAFESQPRSMLLAQGAAECVLRALEMHARAGGVDASRLREVRCYSMLPFIVPKQSR